MAKVNLGKVLVGGIVAGVIINLGMFVFSMYIIGEAARAAMARLGLPEPGGAAMTLYFLMGFVLGILTIWLYAAIRPRYGPGPRTAMLAAAAAWALYFGLGGLDWIASGAWPMGIGVAGILWGFLLLTVASLAGARLYAEAGPV